MGFAANWFWEILKHQLLFAKSQFADKMVAERLHNELGVMQTLSGYGQGPGNDCVNIKLSSDSDFVIGSSDVINTAALSESAETLVGPGGISIDSVGTILNDGILRCHSVDGGNRGVINPNCCGALNLKSVGGVTNNGLIECVPSPNAQIGTRNMVIGTDGLFENNGTVDG